MAAQQLLNLRLSVPTYCDDVMRALSFRARRCGARPPLQTTPKWYLYNQITITGVAFSLKCGAWSYSG